MNSKKVRGSKNIFHLILLFTFLIILWLFPDAFRANRSITWYFSAIVISIIFMIKYRSITKNDIIIAIILGIIFMIADPFVGITTMFAYAGGQSVFRNSTNKIVLIKGGNKKNIATTALLTVVVGVFLGIVNLFLANMEMEINFGFGLDFVFKALKAGISEEIIFRFLLFAVCVHITKDKVLSKFENILCYGIMVLPHVLIHFTVFNIDVINIIILSVLFGLPFALLQRKRDLSTAMGSHFLVDIIRFCVYRA